MQLPSTSQADAVLIALYRAAVDRTQLSAALQQVSTWLGMQHHQLVAMHADGRFLSHLDVASRDDMAHWGTRYNEQFAGRDPREAAAQQDRLFIDEEWFDDAYADRSDFYQEWLQPMGARRHIGLRLREPDGKLLAFAMLADARQRRLDEEQLRRCRMLEPHLRAAFEMMLRVSELEAQAARGQAALDAADDGVLVLDAEDRITFANRRAESLLREAQIVSVVAGKLVMRGTEGVRLAQALRGVRQAQRPASIRASVPGARGKPAQPLYLVIRPMLPSACGVAVADAGRVAGNEVLLLITTPGRQRTSSAQQLMQWFDLTPAEARLAHGLLSGLSVAGYCVAHGVSDATARTQLKALFYKTGTERQPDLMRLLAALPSVRDGAPTNPGAPSGRT